MESIPLLDELVKEYLLFRGYVKTYTTFNTEKTNDKTSNVDVCFLLLSLRLFTFSLLSLLSAFLLCALCCSLFLIIRLISLQSNYSIQFEDWIFLHSRFVFVFVKGRLLLISRSFSFPLWLSGFVANPRVSVFHSFAFFI
jgi:hypothetical protein